MTIKNAYKNIIKQCPIFNQSAIDFLKKLNTLLESFDEAYCDTLKEEWHKLIRNEFGDFDKFKETFHLIEEVEDTMNDIANYCGNYWEERNK